jgi:hypothetical protein
VNRQQTNEHSVTSVLPDERGPDESITAFTMRKIRNEVIEQCAHAAEKAWPLGDYPLASENTDVYRGQDHAARTIIKAIRGLKK